MTLRPNGARRSWTCVNNQLLEAKPPTSTTCEIDLCAVLVWSMMASTMHWTDGSKNAATWALDSPCLTLDHAAKERSSLTLSTSAGQSGCCNLGRCPSSNRIWCIAPVCHHWSGSLSSYRSSGRCGRGLRGSQTLPKFLHEYVRVSPNHRTREVIFIAPCNANRAWMLTNTEPKKWHCGAAISSKLASMLDDLVTCCRQ